MATDSATTTTPEGTTTAASPAASSALAGRARLVLMVLCAAQFMVGLDFSILNVALPELGADLGFSTANLQWAVTAFALPSGGLLLLAGRISDLYGRRRLFLAGLVLFAAASALAALAWGPAAFLAGRVLQGIAAAVIVPAGMALLTTSFAEGPQRAKAMSVMGSIMALGFTAGMVLGGVLAQAFGWRSTMWLLGGAALAVLFAAPGLLTESRRPDRPRLDIPGAVTVTGGLLALIYALSTAAEHGFGRGDVIGGLIAAAVLLPAFVAIESRTAEPLVSMRLLRRRNVAFGAAGGLITFSMMSSVIFLTTLYLQEIRGMSPMTSGLIFGVLGLAAAAGGAVAPKVLARLGAKSTLVAGLIGQAVFTATLIAIGDSALGVWLILVPGSVACFFHLFAIVAYQITVTTGVPNEQQGLATGIVTSAQQIGLTVGIPLLSALAASNTELLSGLRLGLGADALVLAATAVLVAVALPRVRR
ncbi:MFS transporter [Streptomyces sp. A7024]|uniref:MFS transporter n=1 Tax=Streptomyces coryli TaxID=1128680 RepID=A0A6G4U0Z6_9ACTN|nr:MFS transporter [Streptomyces coryli]NGN65824.1 MFS transporter [Streptomyces coryli]